MKKLNLTRLYANICMKMKTFVAKIKPKLIPFHTLVDCTDCKIFIFLMNANKKEKVLVCKVQLRGNDEDWTWRMFFVWGKFWIFIFISIFSSLSNPQNFIKIHEMIFKNKNGVYEEITFSQGSNIIFFYKEISLQIWQLWENLKITPQKKYWEQNWELLRISSLYLINSKDNFFKWSYLKVKKLLN